MQSDAKQTFTVTKFVSVSAILWAGGLSKLNPGADLRLYLSLHTPAIKNN